MEFRLLGPLEVTEDGRTLSLGGSRARALLALLLLHRNQLLAIDRIVEDLWAERPPKTGGQVVRVYVSHLRKALEPDHLNGQRQILVTQRNGYSLRVDPCQVDVDRFEALQAEGRRLLAAGEIADAANTLEKGLSLWRGPPLQDFAYEAFAQTEIARLEELHLATLEDLFDAQLAGGRDSDLVADLEQLVDAHPLRERLRAQLMLALYRGGRPADALETYQRGRRLLAGELGLEPGETLRRLETRILQQDPALDRPNVPRRAEKPAPPPPARSRRLVTRAIAGLLLGAAVTVGLLTLATAGQGQKPARVALVVSETRDLTDTSPAGAAPIMGLRAAAKQVGLHMKVLYGGYTLSGFLGKLRVAAQTSDLVIVGATSNPAAVSELTRQYPGTQFVVRDSISDKHASFGGQKNVTGLNFNDRENGYLGGYLAGLMTHGDQKVSAIGGAPTEAERALIAGFAAGARRARPHIGVLVHYAGTPLTAAPCESVANRQIKHGSHVIFDAAGIFDAGGDCGFAALQAAVTFSGVWGLGAGTNLSWVGPKMLGSVVERTDRAIQLAVTLFAAGQLPHGRDLPLDLASGDIGLIGISPRVPTTAKAKVESVERKLLARDQARHSR
jgi:DNA-binding SARP family transcriptional activator/basic membrane lipoprotein Med (substrate-binding protein (PBP1-ABC) superfamily)